MLFSEVTLGNLSYTPKTCPAGVPAQLDGLIALQ